MSRRAIITARATAALAGLVPAVVTAAPYTAGQLVVVRVDTISVPSSGIFAGGINLVQFDPTATAQPGSVVTALTATHNVRVDATPSNNVAEGSLARSPDGTLISLGGYVGTGSRNTTARANAIVEGGGTVTLRGYSGLSSSGVQSGLATGLTAAWTGESDGLRYVGSPAVAKVIPSGEVRTMAATATNFYYSTPTAIFRADGYPTAPGPTTYQTVLKNSGSPREFVVSDDGLTIYVADDRSTSSGGGLEKWAWDAGLNRHTLRYTIKTIMPSDGGTSGIRGLAVDFLNNTIYATTAHTTGNRLVRITDGGTFDKFTITELARAETNTVFRGVELAPDDSNFVTPTAAVAFGRVLKGSAATRTVDFTNAGNTLSTVKVTATGAASGTVPAGVVGSGGTRSLGVSIDTTTAGAVTGSLTVSGTSGVDAPDTVDVTGTVVAGSAASLADADASLGTVWLGSGAQQVTLAKLITALAGEDGAALTAGLDLDAITPLSGDTAEIGLSGDLFDDLAAGGTAELTATVLTDAAGVYAATYRLAFSDADDVLGGSAFASSFRDVTVSVEVAHTPEPGAIVVLAAVGAIVLARRPRCR